jgi:8-oxo-dGTP pyrophosphatase MutT (NUDIX family)
MRTILPAKHRLVPKHAKKVFTGNIFDVYQWEQELFDGSKATFEMLKRPDTIQVLAVKDHKLVLLREEQPSMGPAYYSLPGGRHDVEAETELDAAKRELREETGMIFSDWRLIEIEQPHTKIDWFIYYFLASGYESQGDVHLDPGEKIEVLEADYDEILKLGRNEDLHHLPVRLLEQAKSIDGLTKLPQYGS